MGSLDGKHVVIQAPVSTGSQFFNYTNYFSIVLMALVDADYNFMFVDVGCQGRLSDGAVFKNTELFTRIHNDQLNCPPDEPLPERKKTSAFRLCWR